MNKKFSYHLLGYTLIAIAPILTADHTANHLAESAREGIKSEILDVITRIPAGDRNRQLRALTAIENRTEAGEDGENADITGITNLARFITYGEVAAAMYLINRGADLQAETIFGTNLLHCAAVHPANIHLAQFLINHGLDINQKDSAFAITPLFIAIFFGNEPMVRCLIENGAEINTRLALLDITPLHLAVQMRRRSISQYLIDHGADSNAELSIAHLTPLMLLKLRVHHIIPPGTSALMMLVNSRDTESEALEKYLSAHGGTGNFDELVPLILEFITFYHGTLMLSKTPALLAPKIHEGLFNLTQLHIAAAQGSAEDVRSLILGGADINMQDNALGLAPLHIATPEAAAMLLAYGAKADIKTPCLGIQPLLLAIAKKDLTTARVLLKYGADINAPSDVYGITPLLYACLQNNYAAVKFLLEQGACVTARMAGGLTALDIAKGRGSKELEKLLQSRWSV